MKRKPQKPPTKIKMQKLSYLIVLSLLVSGIMFTVSAKPLLAVPYISSSACCLIECSSGQILYSRHAHEERQVASTTKMMTAIIAREYCRVNETAVVSSEAARTPRYVIGLRQGQKLTVEELLKAGLICSANDAAVVLAEHCAGEQALFAHLMSQKAFLLGARHTHFANASGLPNHDNYSTAYDLALIGRYLCHDPYLARIVATKQTKFKHPSYTQVIDITNSNRLLESYPGANGIKTGTTNDAGKCLVASAIRKGRHLIAVALQSGDRSGDCTRLLNYGFNNCKPVKVIDHSQIFKELRVKNGSMAYARIYPGQDLFLWQGEKDLNFEKRVKINYDLQAPIRPGQKVGALSVYVDGGLVDSTDLVSGDAVERHSNIFQRIKDIIY
ncbi:D-alanyl-D-alanine carboxypeptidase family protein [Syntrophomonas palmitatica]|uniref:D-alanyl-D-alanine carboxypeptidase family protein n=1 Tax=Syntrophomonas palmitatica TaxID=402877 RepID=UPI0006CFC38A|nr:D-alanyl-D-alanine carboxypeptidase family protein [Syntrophomonas palmitatica]